MKTLPVDLPLIVALMASAWLLYVIFHLAFGVDAYSFGQAVVTVSACVASALIGCELREECYFERYLDEIEE